MNSLEMHVHNNVHSHVLTEAAFFQCNHSCRLMQTFCMCLCPPTGILHGAGLWQLPKQLYLPTEEKSAQAPNSHLKYVWYGSLCRSRTRAPASAVLGSSPGSAALSLRILSSFSAVLFKKKKKKASQYSFLTSKKKEESGKKVDLDLTHGSQPALPCSHRAMLKGFYKRSAKSRQLGIALV